MTQQRTTMFPSALNNRRLGAGLGLGLALGCLLFISPPRCEAQNLIPNPSFEEADTCLILNTYYYPDTGPLHWFTGGGTTDHFQSCLPYGAFNSVPLNVVTFQFPFEGEAYGGMMTYDAAFEGREYWMVQLSLPLVIGQTYYTSLYANAAFRNDGQSFQAWIASSGVGMLFTMDPRQHEPGEPRPGPGNFAHVYSAAILSDTAEWVLVSGSFVADSAYRYVLLGNHFDNANTDTLHFEYRTNNARGYTVIDNVCVSATPLGCPMVVNVGEYGRDRMRLYPNPAQQSVMVSGVESGASLNVYDVLGRCVWQGGATASRMQLDVGSWARGTYVLHMEGSGRHQSFKFVLIE